MSNLQHLVNYRSPNPSDINFFYSTWLKSYRQSSFATSICNEVFFAEHKSIIESILLNPNTNITVICNAQDQDQIYGYLVEDKIHKILHFAYIKYNYRKFHLMLTLLSHLGYITPNKATPTFITHLPRQYDIISEKYGFLYNPYLLRT